MRQSTILIPEVGDRVWVLLREHLLALPIVARADITSSRLMIETIHSSKIDSFPAATCFQEWRVDASIVDPTTEEKLTTCVWVGGHIQPMKHPLGMGKINLNDRVIDGPFVHRSEALRRAASRGRWLANTLSALVADPKSGRCGNKSCPIDHLAEARNVCDVVAIAEQEASMYESLEAEHPAPKNDDEDREGEE